MCVCVDPPHGRAGQWLSCCLSAGRSFSSPLSGGRTYSSGKTESARLERERETNTETVALRYYNTCTLGKVTALGVLCCFALLFV